MKTKTITSPAGEDLNALLDKIESTPDAFTYGRRNNDLVNWFLTKRMINIDDGKDGLVAYDYIGEFNKVKAKLSDTQKKDLKDFSGGVDAKIEDLFVYYGREKNPLRFINLWLPMEYSI